MQKRTREIAALALLAMMGIIAVCVMGWYILVGHNWNVAASNIDDTIGQMDGYTVFLCAGTNLPDAEKQRLSDAQPMLDEQNRPIRDAVSPQSPHPPLAVDDVAASYRDKGAAVFTLDAAQLTLYEEPMVVAKQGRRVGLFSMGAREHPARARVNVKELAAHDAGFVVCLTDDAGLIEYQLPGINVMVCSSEDADAPNGGGWRGSTFYVGTAYIGEIRAIVVSPSGVISSKVISEL